MIPAEEYYNKTATSSEANTFYEAKSATEGDAADCDYLIKEALPYSILKTRITEALIKDQSVKKSKEGAIDLSFTKKTFDEYKESYKVYQKWIRDYISRHYLGMEKPYSGKKTKYYKLGEISSIMTSGIVGFNVLEDAILDSNTNDIFCNAWNEIYVEDNESIRLYDKIFDSEKEYNNFVQSLLFEDDRQLDDGAHKIQDFEIYGMRGNAVGTAVASKGIALTIRKHSEKPIKLTQMIEKKLLNEKMADFLRMVVIGETGSFVSGITGSGKTTLLKAVYEDALSEKTLEKFNVTSRFKRIIVCEDTPELDLKTTNTVLERTVVTGDNTTSKSLDGLIINSLRQRPRYVLVGECRGPAEIAAFVDLCSSGHGGSSTIHARDVEEAMGRLIRRYMETQGDIKAELAREFVGSSLDYLIQIGIYTDGNIGRRITGIYEISYDYNRERVRIKPIVEYDPAADDWVWRNKISKKQVSLINQRGVPIAKIEEMQNFILEHRVKEVEEED